MAISPAHSAAARSNGALSSGPATAEGKSRSAQNARKHSFFSSLALLSSEDSEELEQLAAGFLAEYEPETPTENHYVRDMIDAEWRLQRVRSHSSAIQNTRAATLQKETASPTPDYHTAAEAFRQLAQEGPSLHLLLRYETQFRRQFDKSLQMLLDFRLRRETDAGKIEKEVFAEQKRAIEAIVNAPLPSQILRAHAEAQPPQPPPPAPPPVANPSNINVQNEPTAPTAPAPQPPAAEPAEPLIPRNSSCPCGSREKYKRCCGRNAPPVLSRAA